MGPIVFVVFLAVIVFAVRELLSNTSLRQQYGSRSTTKMGVAVRSRGEQQIGDYFTEIGLRYNYEQVLEAGIWIFTQEVARPDFYLPDYDVYVEYWGMLDVDDPSERHRYEGLMRYKMRRYHELGIRFISIYPSNLANLDWIFRKKFRDVTGKNLPHTV